VDLPPNQHLAAPGKWPVVGERAPRADDAPWTVTVAGLVAAPRTFTLSELRQLFEPVERATDIHCVTRWSKPAVLFGGVRLADALAECGPLSDARFASFVARSDRNHSTSLPLADALALGTLIAFSADGAPLAGEHGGPVRTVVPGRYFYKSLKWLERIELLTEDRLGYWEAEAGYHNGADPWREERYIAPDALRQVIEKALRTRDFSGLDLRGIDARGRDLTGLVARDARLRDAHFERATLTGGDFSGANLSNAHLQGADLRGVNFRGADVEGAAFDGADLAGADFEGASLFGATFAGARIDAALATTLDTP
jgi:DMSO/TMAO reductase YedYZ molybdopterin-dependent catalytic subunit